MNEDDNQKVGSNQTLQTKCDDERRVAVKGIAALSMSDSSRPWTLADDESTNLGESYEPNSNDVICGRGRRAWDHKGNARFRSLLETHMTEYENAKTKLNKTLLVSQIMEQVEEANPPGRFIKQEEGGNWTIVSLATAREKVGQGFRDLLQVKYKSNFTAKKCRRSQDTNLAASPRFSPTNSTKSASTRSSESAPSKSLKIHRATSILSRASSLGSIGADSLQDNTLSDSTGGGLQPELHRAHTSDNLRKTPYVVNSDLHREDVESFKESDDQHQALLKAIAASADTRDLPASDCFAQRPQASPYHDNTWTSGTLFDDELDQENVLQQHMLLLRASHRRAALPIFQTTQLSSPSSGHMDISLNLQQQQHQQLHRGGQQEQPPIRRLGLPPSANSSIGGSLHQPFFPTLCSQFGDGFTVNSGQTPSDLLTQQNWQEMQQGMGHMSTTSATCREEARSLAHKHAEAWARSQQKSFYFPQQQQHVPMPRIPGHPQQQLQHQNHDMTMSTIRHTLSTHHCHDVQQSLSFDNPGIVRPWQRWQQQQQLQEQPQQLAGPFFGPAGAIQTPDTHFFQPITEPSQPQHANDGIEEDMEILFRDDLCTDQWPSAIATAAPPPPSDDDESTY